MDFAKALELHDKLAARARRLHEIDDEFPVSIRIEGDTAICTVPAIDYGVYDDPSTELTTEDRACPAALLLATDEAFEAALPEWTAEQERAKEAALLKRYEWSKRFAREMLGTYMSEFGNISLRKP